MSSPAAASAPSTDGASIVRVLLPNKKTVDVGVPAGKNACCEVKRVVQSLLQISPLLQRVQLDAVGVDAFTTPLSVRVTQRTPPRVESRTLDVYLMSENHIDGVTKFSVKVDPTDSVLDLKFLLADKLQVAPDFQRLYLRAPGSVSRVEMRDSLTLRDANAFSGRVRAMFEFPSGLAGHGTIHACRPTPIMRVNENIKTVGDMFVNAVKTHGKRNFLGTHMNTKPEYKWITYAEAGARVFNLAAGFRTLGLNPKDCVGIVGTNRAEWVLTDMTCNVTGFISVPLYDTLGPDAIQYIINHAGLRAVVGSAKELKALNAIRSKCPSLEFIILMDNADALDAKAVASAPKELYSYKLSEVEAIGAKNTDKHPVGKSLTKPEDVHTICYTSGTTGNPKGVVLTQLNIVSAADAIADRTPAEEKGDNEVLFSYMPLAHIYQRAADCMMIAMAGGLGFFRGDPLKLVEDVAALRPTIFPGVPRVWQRIYDRVMMGVDEGGFIKGQIFHRSLASKVDMLHRGELTPDMKLVAPLADKLVFSKIAQLFGGRVKLMASGAAPLPAKVGDFMRVGFMSNFVEGYGLTETGAALSTSSREDCTYGHVGTPLDCCQVKLVDVPDMEYLSTDKPHPRGEVWVYGNNIFQGYYKQPDATAEVFQTDAEGRRWFMTGDIAQWLPDGSLKIIDRKKSLFKLSQGEYLRPEHIENVYKLTKELGNIFVHGDSNENYLVAIVYPQPDLLKAFVAQNGIKGATIQEQVKDPRVAAYLLKAMNATAEREKLRGFELVKKIHVIGEDFSMENGLLTPTLKLKRNIAKKYFAEQCAKLYKEGEAAAKQIKAKL